MDGAAAVIDWVGWEWEGDTAAWGAGRGGRRHACMRAVAPLIGEREGSELVTEREVGAPEWSLPQLDRCCFWGRRRNGRSSTQQGLRGPAGEAVRFV